ncbi:unnamed protein product [Sphagnum jensenii]|uniref:Uncharacterized protein n=1 Tax=Sphagnum jensenii TaxID=128206 RepID=A0ABP0X8J8_9BRYO
MPPASFDFNPGADGGRLEPGQLLHTWHQHLVRDVFRRSYDQYPRRTRQTVERTRASGDPNRQYLIGGETRAWRTAVVSTATMQTRFVWVHDNILRPMAHDHTYYISILNLSINRCTIAV